MMFDMLYGPRVTFSRYTLPVTSRWRWINYATFLWTASMTESFQAPLYATRIDPNLSLRILGGPFVDIDDALDCLWEHLNEDESSRESLLLISMASGVPRIHPLPAEVLPAD